MQRRVLEPQELAEVVAPRRALICLGCRHHPAVTLGLLAHRLVDAAHRVPVGSPVRPLHGSGQHVLEIVDVDTVGNEARLPVMRCDLHTVHRSVHQTGAPRNRRPISPLPSTPAPVPSRRIRPLSSTTPWLARPSPERAFCSTSRMVRPALFMSRIRSNTTV